MKTSMYYDSLVKICQNTYGETRGLFLANRIASAISRTKDYCIDNLRIADTSKKSELVLYNNVKSEGCWGFYDDECIFVDKKTGEKTRYLFGFNYGH